MQRLLVLLLVQLLYAGKCTSTPAPHHEEKHKGNSHGHWSYEGKEAWSKDYKLCEGHAQSPINIVVRKTLLKTSLVPITVEGYNLPEADLLTLSNNGHTVQLSLPDTMSITSGLSQTYRAAQLHLHWGCGDTLGSEHTVDSTRYPAEIHFVHFAAKYGSLQEAMHKDDGLAVLGAFFEVGPQENEHYNHIFKKLEDITEEGSKVSIPGFDIKNLLPRQLGHYFRYSGSLTTPPCDQTVNWTIFKDTIQISQLQLHRLKSSLRTSDNQILSCNYRDVQPLNRRPVFVSFPEGLLHREVPEGGSTKSDGDSVRTGDLLAIIFGILFGCTALAFVLYVIKQKKRQRLNTERGPKVIYKPTATAEA
ncbi:carbonic anhydrase 9 isoform X2 [Callorhinchus milii]|uniref:carbonic anhydrase 9 isoform X2 n=1 Tax=Callorhinchus milii TaxID=7868 RepID=UPI00045726C7|nr:carbonic anhydrase 9 isoform X2 [Callorhinchus milii]|eukprot:gi/632959002/ref/XP_007895370.1/ PREDICTED: carbonic anhydrase 9 isoform X2 [Callorhinchus milii]